MQFFELLRARGLGAAPPPPTALGPSAHTSLTNSCRSHTPACPSCCQWCRWPLACGVHSAVAYRSQLDDSQTPQNTKHPKTPRTSQTPDTRHQTPNTRHQTPDTIHQTPDIRHQISDDARTRTQPHGRRTNGSPTTHKQTAAACNTQTSTHTQGPLASFNRMQLCRSGCDLLQRTLRLLPRLGGQVPGHAGVGEGGLQLARVLGQEGRLRPQGRVPDEQEGLCRSACGGGAR